MKRLRFDAVQRGYIFEHKGEKYIKLAKPVRITPKLTFNAVANNGELINFFPYEEVTQVGSFASK